eukprot:gene13427-13555_t
MTHIWHTQQLSVTGPVEQISAAAVQQSEMQQVSAGAESLISISGSGDSPPFWPNITFELPPELSAGQNIYRAQLLVTPKANACEEFWAMNPSGSQTGGCGCRQYGQYVYWQPDRQGGVDPRLWSSIVAHQTYQLPTYTFDLSPWLGLLNTPPTQRVRGKAQPWPEQQAAASHNPSQHADMAADAEDPDLVSEFQETVDEDTNFQQQQQQQQSTGLEGRDSSREGAQFEFSNNITLLVPTVYRTLLAASGAGSQQQSESAATAVAGETITTGRQRHYQQAIMVSVYDPKQFQCSIIDNATHTASINSTISSRVSDVDAAAATQKGTDTGAGSCQAWKASTTYCSAKLLSNVRQDLDGC